MNDKTRRPAETPHEIANPQKSRQGLERVWHATLISLAGFRTGWREAAFRQEVVCAIVMLPAAFWVGRNWVEVAVLSMAVVLVLIVEEVSFEAERFDFYGLATGPALDAFGPAFTDAFDL